MNEFILKWLASGTIGLVVCSSLWLAGSVQRDVSGTIIGQATPAKHHKDVRADAKPVDTTASGLLVKANVGVN